MVFTGKMPKIKVCTYPRKEVDETLELPEGATAMDIFRATDLRPDSWILVRDNRVIPDDEPLRDGDSIKLLSVISGGIWPS